MAEANRINSENSGALSNEFTPQEVEFEINRLHKRIDDVFSEGLLTVKTRRVSTTPQYFQASDGVMEVDTGVVAITVQLPRASELIPKRIYGIKDVGGLAGTRNITTLPFPGELIDGATSKTTSTNYASFLFYSDGTQILVIS